MNICMVSHDFPPTGGGISAHVHELAKSLVKLGNKVYVVAPQLEKSDQKFELMDGISVYRIKKRKVRKVRMVDYIIKASIFINWLVLIKKIDIIHYHFLFPESVITKFIFGKPVVFTNHESHFLYMDERGQGSQLRYYFSHPEFLIAPSIELVEKSIKYGRFPKGSQFISNGVDSNKFHPDKNNDFLRKKYHISKNDKIVLCARRLVEKNGVIYFIDSIPHILEKIQAVKFVIVGDGLLKDQLMKRATDLKIDEYIIWTGYIPNHEMPSYYASSDLVVLPSLKEATSIAGLEAMSSGKALIGTNVGGIPVLIDDNSNGKLVPPKDPLSLATAIVEVLADKKYVEMGKKSRVKVEQQFSWLNIAKQTQNIYEKVIS